MKRLFSVFMVLLVTSVYAFSAGASMNCKGHVVDENGEPLIGVSIVVTNGNPVGTTKYADRKSVV